MDAAFNDTLHGLAILLERAGLGDRARSLQAASAADLPRLAQRIAADLHDARRTRLACAFAAFELATRHATQPGLEDIAARNLRSARRFAALDDVALSVR